MTRGGEATQVLWEEDYNELHLIDVGLKPLANERRENVSAIKDVGEVCNEIPNLGLFPPRLHLLTSPPRTPQALSCIAPAHSSPFIYSLSRHLFFPPYKSRTQTLEILFTRSVFAVLLLPSLRLVKKRNAFARLFQHFSTI